MSLWIFPILISVFFSFFFFRAAHVAYESSQARGWIGAVAASHSTAVSRHPSRMWQCQILNPLSEARDWNCIHMDTNWVLNLSGYDGRSFCHFLMLTTILWVHIPTLFPFLLPHLPPACPSPSLLVCLIWMLKAMAWSTNVRHFSDSYLCWGFS